MSAQWTADQLLLIHRLRAEIGPTLPRYNPRPQGVIRPDSATEAVLAILRAQPRRWWQHNELVKATGKSYTAVNWAVLYLRRRQLCETTPDGRNARYWRYRLSEGGGVSR